MSLDWSGDWWSRYGVHAPDAHVGDRNVVATLLGPGGEVLSQLLDRPHVTPGFNGEPVTRWVRR